MSNPTPPIRLLVVSTNLDTGGAQRFTSTLLCHLDREAFSAQLCLLRPEIGFSLPSDIPTHTLDYHRRPWRLPPTILALRRLVDEVRPDLVLSNITATNLVTGAALWNSSHQPPWLARIGNDPHRHDRRWRAFWARRLYPAASRIVVNAHRLADSVAACYPSAAGKLEVLPTPTDFEALERLAAEEPELRHTLQQPLLIAVGRLFEQKRYDLMLEAFSMVRRVRPATLWICGDGPRKAAIERQLRRLGLEDSVRLLGFCRNPFALMRQADLFLMTSDHEGLPNALIEAQGLGVPAVSTDCPYGPSEIVVDGRTGHLVPVGDVQRVARAALEVIENTSHRERLAEGARATARERFGLPTTINRWQSLIERLVRERQGEGAGS